MIEKATRGYRTCTRCQRVLPSEAYDRYKKTGQMKAKCRECPDKFRRSDKPWQIPNPCAHCGKTFFREGPWSHVKILKYCSSDCRYEAARGTERTCRRCKRTLPVSNFLRGTERQKTSLFCHKCEEDHDLIPGLPLRPRPSPYSLWVKARRQAVLMGCPLRVTQRQVRALHGADCDLCGRAVSSLLPIDRQTPWDLANTRKLCRRCNKMVRSVPYQELLLWANEVALRNPLAPEETTDAEPIPSPPRRRRQRRAIA